MIEYQNARGFRKAQRCLRLYFLITQSHETTALAFCKVKRPLVKRNLAIHLYVKKYIILLLLPLLASPRRMLAPLPVKRLLSLAPVFTPAASHGIQ